MSIQLQLEDTMPLGAAVQQSAVQQSTGDILEMAMNHCDFANVLQALPYASTSTPLPQLLPEIEATRKRRNAAKRTSSKKEDVVAVKSKKSTNRKETSAEDDVRKKTVKMKKRLSDDGTIQDAEVLCKKVLETYFERRRSHRSSSSSRHNTLEAIVDSVELDMVTLFAVQNLRTVRQPPSSDDVARSVIKALTTLMLR